MGTRGAAGRRGRRAEHGLLAQSGHHIAQHRAGRGTLTCSAPVVELRSGEIALQGHRVELLHHLADQPGPAHQRGVHSQFDLVVGETADGQHLDPKPVALGPIEIEGSQALDALGVDVGVEDGPLQRQAGQHRQLMGGISPEISRVGSASANPFS